MKYKVLAISILTIVTLCVAWFVWPKPKTPTNNQLAVSKDKTLTAYANPYTSVQDFMQGIYLTDKHPTSTSTQTIRAVIVPHHLVASEVTALGIKSLKDQNIKNILLISPDHFHRCPNLFCTTDRSFQTFFGRVDVSSSTIQSLLNSNLVTKEPELFKQEHGINAITPFIAHYLPNVTITPLVLSQDIPWLPKQNELYALLEKVMDKNTVLVVSSDFSHYLTLSQAQHMDDLTQKDLLSKDLNSIALLKNPAQSDCPGCLWLLASLAQNYNFYNPQILMHTNSAQILNDLTIKQTTSHFCITWRADQTN